MKKSAHCKEFRPLGEYVFNNKFLETRQKHCRTCMKKFNRASYLRRSKTRKQEVKENRQKKREEAQLFIWDCHATHPCVDCGETGPVILEFDHVCGRKLKVVGGMARLGYAIDTIRKEIDKCEVRCANCHRRRTSSKERGWFRGQIWMKRKFLSLKDTGL